MQATTPPPKDNVEKKFALLAPGSDGGGAGGGEKSEGLALRLYEWGDSHFVHDGFYMEAAGVEQGKTLQIGGRGYRRSSLEVRKDNSRPGRRE